MIDCENNKAKIDFYDDYKKPPTSSSPTSRVNPPHQSLVIVLKQEILLIACPLQPKTTKTLQCWW
jgi:hypothetical protein